MRSPIRQEVKLTVRTADHAAVMAWLRTDPVGLRRAYAPRRVQSIYFDTPAGDALQDNLAGISERRKIRLRWYGPGAASVQGTLEYKLRRNCFGWKETYPVEGDLPLRHEPKAAFARSVREGLPEAGRYAFPGTVQPVQWIRYERQYLAAGAFRVTVDRDIAAFDLRWRRTLDDRFPSDLPGLTVIEVKCALDDHERLEGFLARFPVNRNRCSKYVLAASPDEAPGVSAFSARRGGR